MRTRPRELLALAVIIVAAGLFGRFRSAPPAPSPATTSAPISSAPRVTPPALPDEPATGATVTSFPRPPDEWQGMLVSTENRALCDVSTRCGLAGACLADGQCGACTRDDQCGAGEVCTLDHCVLRARVACRSRHDCKTTELCTLSGYSTDVRGNGALDARCTPTSGSAEPPTHVAEEPIPGPPPAVDARELEVEVTAMAAADL